jgi:DNA-3-methyladenine glycosylase I
MPRDRVRCDWSFGGSPLMLAYHDEEWGVPQHDDRALFELLILEGAQAGLSWNTILNKRDGYRKAFRNFDARKIARFGDRDVERLINDSAIVRNRAKIEATIANARAMLEAQREFGSFDAYIWRFVDGKPRKNAFRMMGDVPPKTEQSDAMSRDLKKRGFKFVGSTICYAFMQAAGLVNDHQVDCFRYKQVLQRGRV